MLLRLITLSCCLLLFAAAASLPAQETQRSGYYGQGNQRVVQPAAYAVESAETGTESPSAAVASVPKVAAPLRLTPRDKAASKEVSHPTVTSPTNAVTTVAGSLGIVLGLFVVLVWFSRRFTPAGTAAIPKEVVELLGRTSLGGTHSMQLVRVGAKLILVALSPQGPRTLTEISSSAEVERLSELCRRQKPDSATASFRSLVEQVGGERTTNTFVDAGRRTPAAATASGTRTPARA